MPKQNPLSNVRNALFACIFIVLVGFLTPALAADDAEKPDRYVQIELIAERSNVSSGDEILVGIEQTIFPHWHTYWFNPGDSGAMPKVTWMAPDGFEFDDIKWPAPKKLPYGPLMNYGYKEKVTLLQTLKLPETLPEGLITLTADIEVLVCEEICIPEYGTYELTLNNPDAPAQDNSDYFSKALDTLPEAVGYDARFGETDSRLSLKIDIPDDKSSLIDSSTFAIFPKDWGVVQYPAPQDITFENGTLSLLQDRGSRSLGALEAANFVVTYNDTNGQKDSFEVQAIPDSSLITSNAQDADTQIDIQGSSNTQMQAFTPDTSDLTIFSALYLALLGGIVLNLMPCVFPVLSIKALSLVKISEESASLVRLHGISYTLGVVLSFMAIAGALIALQAGGAQIGWGFQLQDPFIVGILAYLLFAVGLNLMGFFEISSGRLTNVGGSLTQGKSLSSSFFTGVLATLVATPCTAPFMAAAIGFALVQPVVVSLSIFAALGFGLALPYLLLSFIPNLQKIMPKPGAWMDRFKELLAFPMFASSAWLIWVVSQQSGPSGVFGMLLGLTLIAFSVWLVRVLPSEGSGRRITATLAILSVFAAFGFLPFNQMATATQNVAESMISDENSFSMTWSPTALSEAISSDDPVFVEMTAAWCITCKVNNATSINIRSTKDLFAKNNVQYLIGDWTNQDPEITEYLRKFGRNGVPIYVYYGPKDENGDRPEPIVLPQILTPSTVADIVG